MGGMGLILTPVFMRRLIGPLGLFGPMTSTSGEVAIQHFLALRLITFEKELFAR